MVNPMIFKIAEHLYIFSPVQRLSCWFSKSLWLVFLSAGNLGLILIGHFASLVSWVTGQTECQYPFLDIWR